MLEWLFAGGLFVSSSKCKRYVSNSVNQNKNMLYQKLLIDQDLERQLWYDVCEPCKYDEIWRRIEEFKREHPSICQQDDTNHWGIVGKRRLIIS